MPWNNSQSEDSSLHIQERLFERAKTVGVITEIQIFKLFSKRASMIISSRKKLNNFLTHYPIN